MTIKYTFWRVYSRQAGDIRAVRVFRRLFRDRLRLRSRRVDFAIWRRIRRKSYRQ